MDINVITIEHEDPNKFARDVQDFLEIGYKLESSSCNSRYWKAIMIYRGDKIDK